MSLSGPKPLFFNNVLNNIISGIKTHFSSPQEAIESIIDNADDGRGFIVDPQHPKPCDSDIKSFRENIKQKMKGPIAAEIVKNQETLPTEITKVHKDSSLFGHTEDGTIMGADVCTFGFIIGCLIIVHVVITTAILYSVNIDNIPKYRKVIQGIAWTNVSLLILMVCITLNSRDSSNS